MVMRVSSTARSNFSRLALKPGASSSYSVYEDSGVSVEYQHGMFARTPIRAAQDGDVLRVEIGPVEGNYPRMPKLRRYEVRLPADWPPASVSVNGAAVSQAGPAGEGGWTFEGNTLTTVIPVPATDVAEKVIVEVRRADSLTARRDDLDGFSGAMTRLRGTYDAMHQTGPFSSIPDVLEDAKQSGDRLGYHPEKATEEIAHFHDVLPQAQTAVQKVTQELAQRMDDFVKRMGNDRPPDVEAQRQRRLDAMARAQKLVAEAGK